MTVATGDHLRLLDQLADSVLVVAPIAGPQGAHSAQGVRSTQDGNADFDIVHLSPGYIDPAGRAARDIAGRTLLEAYPDCASGDGLAARAARVLADGAAQYAPGLVGPLTGADHADPVPVADLRAARYDGRVVFTWRARVGDEGRLGEAFAHGRTRVALAAAHDLLADSEQRAAEEHELALRLQRAIMPADVRLVETCGVDIAVRCRPAKAGYLVAGDWYDALQLPDGELLFVVGDIAGHGIDAVTGMVAARNTLRGLAATGADPYELLSRLNYAACVFTEGVTGTVICGRYDPKTQQLRWARAGHLPPVLVRGHLAAVQPLPEGMLLGMELEAEYDQVTLQLMTGDTLLFYTDGLIERRAASIVDALAEFAAAAVPDDPDADVDSHVAQIMANAASDTGDDACLLAVRIR
jgi:serine phosphatase RsbU (regulator of sigma subunit)